MTVQTGSSSVRAERACKAGERSQYPVRPEGRPPRPLVACARAPPAASGTRGSRCRRSPPSRGSPRPPRTPAPAPSRRPRGRPRPATPRSSGGRAAPTRAPERAPPPLSTC
eukprot:5068235-Lingulodinium_polyedra.AAC.1